MSGEFSIGYHTSDWVNFTLKNYFMVSSSLWRFMSWVKLNVAFFRMFTLNWQYRMNILWVLKAMWLLHRHKVYSDLVYEGLSLSNTSSHILTLQISLSLSLSLRVLRSYCIVNVYLFFCRQWHLCPRRMCCSQSIDLWQVSFPLIFTRGLHSQVWYICWKCPLDKCTISTL